MEKFVITSIPGDGVGPELIYCVSDVVKNLGAFSFLLLIAFCSLSKGLNVAGIPLQFEETFLSEIHWSRSASIEDAVAAIKKNHRVALKGVIQESGEQQDFPLKMAWMISSSQRLRS